MYTMRTGIGCVRFTCWGALAFILCNPRKIELETQGACNPADVDNLLAEMIRFFAPGFKAQSRVKRKP